MKLKRVNIRYPWLTPLAGVLMLSYFYLSTNSNLIQFYAIPDTVFQPNIQLAVLLLFMVLTITELALFSRRRMKHNQLLLKHEEQIHDLIYKKNQLHRKAHTYSDHADKLKLFISDRLLEHIEYDEKFLHFKNIASEVRHNGVICYDKVITSLNLASEKSRKNERVQYEEAIQSMLYLWDLLDLSTTDNISIYIANKLYESEEQYYQQHLNEGNHQSPFTPIFDVRHAVLESLHGFIDDNAPFKENPVPEENYQTSNDQFLLSLDHSLELLGNENYIILMVENLINNALYYASIKKYDGPHSRIAIRLTSDQKKAQLSIYNRGPLIDDDTHEQIFNLGFSTKRVKENNGKGLGLYFVNEIIKGYEGSIDFENIENRPDTCIIRIEKDNGEIQSCIVESVVTDDGKPECQEQNSDLLQKKFELKVEGKVKIVEISPQSNQQTFSSGEIKRKDPTVILDQQQPEHPTWSLTIKPQKSLTKIIFEPLDVRGVRFNLALPLAKSRLDASYHEIDADELTDLNEMTSDFKDNDEYVTS